MSTAIVFLLLFILPFFIAPLGITAFENPKVIVGEAGILLLFLIQLFSNKLTIHYRSPQLFIYEVIILLTIIDLLFFRTQLSFFGNVFRMQGTFLLWLLLLFSVLSSTIPLKQIPWFVYGIIVAVELLLLFFLPLNESQRFVGSLGEPNALAAFAIFVWPFSFFAVKTFRKKEKIGMFILFLLVGIILALSDSRSAMIALGIQLLFIFLNKKNIKLVKVIFICIVISLLSYILPFFEHARYENRTEVWQTAVVAGLKQPILGYGFGNTETAIHASAKQLGLPIQYYYVDSAHNIFLDWWVQGGIIGISAMLLLVVLTFFSLTKTNKQRELVILLGMITVLSFNPASIVGLIGFWWLIGQGLYADHSIRSSA